MARSAYTRDGSFQMNAQGQVVTASGYQVQPAITIPPARRASRSRRRRGQRAAGRTKRPDAGRHAAARRLHQPGGPAADGRQPRGGVRRQRLSADGHAGLTGLGTLTQGSVESSNVNVVKEMVNMIETQRAYEMNSKAIETTDQMLQYADQNM